MNLPSQTDVLEAYERIRDHVVKTPVIENQQINDELEARVFFKCENLQHIGAFKARGAINNALQLTKEELSKGLLTYSSGNHAQAVAWAAKQLKSKATICMPTDAPSVKVAGVKRLGATIVFAGTTSDERKAKALEIKEQTKATLIEPFNHPWTIAGQGTATLEFLNQLKEKNVELDSLIVPVGGGGLVAGACLVTKNTGVRMVGVEPFGCDSMHQSIKENTPVSVLPAKTVGDGLKPVSVGNINFNVCKERIDQTIQVNDDEMLAAMVDILTKANTSVEPSGAAAFAALKKMPRAKGECIGLLLSGGNVDPLLISEALQRHA